MARGAAEIADWLGNPLIGGRARLLAGCALATVWPRDAAVAELGSADAQPSGCGAAKETDAAARELRRLGWKTIESHLARIYGKPDVHSCAALTAIIMREGTGAQPP